MNFTFLPVHCWTSINMAVDALSSILFILRPKYSSQKKHLALCLSHITISLVPCTFTFPSNIFPLSRVTNGQTGPNWTSWENVGTSAMQLHKIWNWKLIWTFGFWGSVEKNPLLQRVFLQKHTHTCTHTYTHTHTHKPMYLIWKTNKRNTEQRLEYFKLSESQCKADREF